MASTRDMYCSQFWQLGSLRPRCWQIKFLVRAYLLVCRWLPSWCPPWKREKELWFLPLLIRTLIPFVSTSPAQLVKNLPANAEHARDAGSIPRSGRSLEKEMATHSSILAWRIPWTEEPGRLQSMGSQRVGYDWATNTLMISFKPNYLPKVPSPNTMTSSLRTSTYDFGGCISIQSIAEILQWLLHVEERGLV